MIMKKRLNEIFNLKNGILVSQKNERLPIAYIEADQNDNTFPHKDVIKNKFGGRWIKSKGVWGWFLGDNPQDVYNNKIKPCLDYLISVENNPNGIQRNVTQIIDKLLAELNAPISNLTEIENDARTVLKTKLENFKQDLLSIVDDAAFKAKFEPIIKFNKAQGHRYSFINTILIWIQNPNARMVKSRSNWLKINRTIKSNAQPIFLWAPMGNANYSKQTKAQITKQWLKDHNAKTIKDLSIRDREDLEIALRGVKDNFNVRFALTPHYDWRDTIQIEGKEDLVGDIDAADNIPWFDDSGAETEESVKLIDALMSVIEDSGVQVSYAQDLGGARGVSKSGSIDVLKDATKNIGLFNTLTHEFSHELLHQSYVKTKNPEYEEFFVGKDGGRSIIEQQAELCAWIVLKNFNYDMETNLNYVTIWGLNKDNAATVFDTVANTATFIINKITSKLNSKMHESRNITIAEGFRPSGFQLAKMCGMGKLYVKSAQLEKAKGEDDIEGNEPQVDEQYISNVVSECIDKFINQLM